ncbi:MAG TPA: hypothetical protein VM938_15960 [Acidimicrobiales bacterium]|nr:hypothetical protein [Acidimicrobiales bacterium]
MRTSTVDLPTRLRSRRLDVATAVVAVLLAGLAIFPATAAADEPMAGWWSKLNAGVVPPPNPPDVGEGKLLVDGASYDEEESWAAVAAFSLPLPEGAAPHSVALKMTSTPAMTPASEFPVACRLVRVVAWVENGTWAERPEADCSAGSRGTSGGAGLLRLWDLEDFVRDGRLEVVLVPGGPGRYVLEPPDPGSLTLSFPPTTTTSSTTTTTFVSSDTTSFRSGPSFTAGAPLLPTQPPVTAAPAPQDTSGNLPAAAASFPRPDPVDSTRMRVYMVVALLALAGFTWARHSATALDEGSPEGGAKAP